MSAATYTSYADLRARQKQVAHPEEILAREISSGFTLSSVAASGAAVTLADPALAKVQTVVLTANCTFTFPTPLIGLTFVLTLTQDGTGSRTATWPAAVRWSGGTNPTLTTTAGRRDVFRFVSVDDTTWVGQTVGLNFLP
jgi:hypothetical protein